MALIDPEERTAAAAFTNSVRYPVRPVAPTVAGAVQQAALGLPFFLADGIKAVYDLAIWSWFRRVSLSDHDQETSDTEPADTPDPHNGADLQTIQKHEKVP